MKEFFELLFLALKAWLKGIERKQKILENLDGQKIDVTNEQVTSANSINELLDNITGRLKNELKEDKEND